MTLKTIDNPPSCFPENLFQEPSKISEKIWWVARTKSRQEKTLAWALKAKGVSYYLPLIPQPQKSNGRMRTSLLPLFRGYLFFKGDHQDRSEAFRSGRIAQVFVAEDQEKIIQELAILSQVTLAKMHLTLCDYATSGKRVRIISGPFAGHEGLVKKQKNKTRLVLNLDAIQQAATVEIALDQVQPI